VGAGLFDSDSGRKGLGTFETDTTFAQPPHAAEGKRK